jgi:hypothetical protein
MTLDLQPTSDQRVAQIALMEDVGQGVAVFP